MSADRGKSGAGGRGPGPRAPYFQHDAAFRKGIRKRDPAAWEQLAEGYHATLCGQAARILPDFMSPEDAAGETWQRALDAARTYDTDRQPYPWLARICASVCLDQRRKEFRHTRRLAQFWSARKRRPQASDVRESPEIMRALCTLAPREREVITLRHVFRISIDEIAELLQVKREAVRKARYRGMARLRELLTTGSREASREDRTAVR